MRSSQQVYKMLSACMPAHCQSPCPFVDGCINSVLLQTARC